MDQITSLGTDKMLQSTIASGGGVLGTLLQAKGERQAAEGAQQSALAEAQQYTQAAGQAEAAGQMAAEEKIRQSQYHISRALAVAGASGGGVTDQNVLNIIGNISAEGKLAALKDLYQGSSEAQALRYRGDIARYKGEIEDSSYKRKAGATILSTGSGFSDFLGKADAFYKSRNAAGGAS